MAPTAYAWSRAGGNLIVITTNAGGSSNAQHCLNTQRANGRWTNVYGTSNAVVTSNGAGEICVTLTNGEPVVLLASSSSTTPSPSTTLRTTSTSTACPTAVAVTFSHRITTVPGDTIRLAGSTAQLGSWTPSAAPALSASGYTAANPVWSVTLSMVPGQTVQYKFVRVDGAGVVSWESDPNRAFTVPACQASVGVSSSWR